MIIHMKTSSSSSFVIASRSVEDSLKAIRLVLLSPRSNLLSLTSNRGNFKILNKTILLQPQSKEIASSLVHYKLLGRLTKLFRFCCYAPRNDECRARKDSL